MNPKNTKKLPNHENACANIPCNFRDCDISPLGVAYLTHAIHTHIDMALYAVPEVHAGRQHLGHCEIRVVGN